MAMKHFYPLFHTFIGTIQEAWQSEIMRIMDNPRFRTRENVTVRLVHEKFQNESSITQAQRDEELRLFNLLFDRYTSDGYANFRNRLGFHVDLEEALKEPSNEGNLHEMTNLILDWYRYVGTVYEGEPKFFTVGAQTAGKGMALQFKEMMLDTLFHRSHRQRDRRKKKPRRYG